MNASSNPAIRSAHCALLVVNLTLGIFASGPGLLTPALAQTTYVEAWGWNGEGECNVPAGLNDAIAVTGGSDCSYALRANGTVVAWGNNNIGQCNVPAGLSNVIAISASFQRFALALKSDGTIVGWGNNVQGQLNVPASLSNVIAVAAGGAHSLALKADGTVVAWGQTLCGGSDINPPPGLSNVVAIAGNATSLALKSDGSLVQWDCDEPRVLPNGLPPFTAVVSRQHDIGLLANGTVVAWGLENYGASPAPPGLSNVSAIAAGYAHSLVLLSNGTVVAWGFNESGEGTVPPGVSGVKAIGAGGDHNLIITTIPLIKFGSQPQSATVNPGATTNFTVNATAQVPIGYQWQKNGAAISGATTSSLTLTNVQLSDAASYTVVVSHPTLTLTSSIALLNVIPFPLPTIVSQPKNWFIPQGSPASFSITATSAVPMTFQWQLNGAILSGQTATNLVIASTTPGDAGNYQAIVSNSSGSVTSAPGNLTFRSSPFNIPSPSTVISLGGATPPSGLDDVIAIAAGYGQQLAVHSNGTVVSWGNNLFPNTPPPTSLTNAIAVASGGINNIALTSDGTVVGWGHNATPPVGLSGVVAIASGHDSSMALKSDGTAVMWGSIVQTPPSSSVSNYAGIAIVNNSAVEVLSDGTVPPNSSLPWGGPSGYPGANNVVALASSSLAFMAILRNDGTVTGAGGGVSPAVSNVVAISPGLALRSDGSVMSLDGTVYPGLSHVTAIAGSPGNGLVLTRWPAIVQPLANVVVNGGLSTNVSVSAFGAPPLSYQWRKNGVDVSGATDSSLVISNAQLIDAGTYNVVVANNAGSITSTLAAVTVNGFPGVTTPQSATLYAGMKIDLTVAATGAQPLTYQWQRNGGDVAGATTNILSLSNVQSGDAGSYTVIVSNSLGSVTSAPGVLTLSSNSFKLPNPGTVVGLGGSPVPPGLTNVIAIGLTYGQALAVRSDGTVVSWGQALTPMTIPSGLSNVVAVAAGGVFNAALKNDGTVVGWGQSAKPPAGLFGVVAIAAGHDSCMALKGDGTAVMWGGITQLPPAPLSNYAAITIVNNVGVGVLNNGTIPANASLLNLSGPPQPQYFPGASNVVAAAGSGFMSMAMLRNDGTVSGFNLGIPPGLSNVVAISGGLALRSDGTVVGLNGTVPPGLTNVAAIAGTVGKGLVLTTNPPPPVLAGESSGGNFVIATPLSVPGYVLTSSDSPTGPFTDVAGYTNGVTDTNGIVVPMSGPKQYYRLRKQ